MKKILSFLMITFMILPLSGQEKKVKTGWKFGGALPAISFDTDLGFQYGALAEFYNYGDGSIYPDYLDHIYAEVSRFTKGSGVYRFMYESNQLIPGVHMTSDLSYLPDQANHFYGFNGAESIFNADWMDEEAADYRSRMFYRFERNLFRFKSDFQGRLAGEHLQWSAGLTFLNFKNSSVNIDKLNKGKDEKLPSVTEMPGLFERYQLLGLISNNEADGGWVNSLRAGITWDSRDNRPNPMKGLWTEAGVEIVPEFMGNDWGFTKFYATHRQYFTLVENDLSLVYRLGYQTTLSGDVPFFYQSQVITSILTGYSSEGLGGSSSMRGILKNRIIGDAFILGNIELRWKPIYFTLFNQDCYLGLNLFYDFGRITSSIDMPSDLEADFARLYPDEVFSDYFNPGGEKLHQSAGISIMPVMNHNFVVAVDIGKSFNKQDGNIGISIGLKYLF